VLIVLLGLISAAWLRETKYPSPAAISKLRLAAQQAGIFPERDSSAETNGE
jgi:hypothetical protein